jgi:hypothetical protein
MPAPEGRSFRPLFERWSRRVRARLALRHVLTGAAVGLIVGAGATAALWQTRHGGLRPLGAAGGLLGAAAGLALARRRRWGDADVALYLDARLHADEAIATAVELQQRPDEGDDSARAFVVTQAAGALAKATPKQVRAPMIRLSHAALPVAAAAIAWICLAPLPPLPPRPAAPPGVDRVQLTKVEGLEKVLALAESSARDEAQRDRLRKLAEDAKKIRDKLKDGVEKREAQADIARLRDGITAERLSLGEGEQRQGMESALGKLGENPDLKNAQKALGDRDLVSLDDEMERLANKLEKDDRRRALETLAEAAEAARKNGAPSVAKALEEERRRLAEKGKKADKLRELARELGEGLGKDGKDALRDFDRSGSPKDEQKLAEKLEEALGKMTPEERKQLAENLKKKMAEAPEEGTGKGPSKQQLKDLVDELDTPEGQQQLEDELKRMAEAPEPGSEEGERQKKLDDAQEGAGDAEKQLGQGTPLPLPVAGDGKGGKGGPKGGSGDGKGGKGDGESGPGHTEGGGPADHRGLTGVVEGGGLTAKAGAKVNKGRPMPGVVMGRTTGKPGETANVLGTGALGDAAPGEVGGIDRSDVPEEYREQVGRYFQPK